MRTFSAAVGRLTFTIARALVSAEILQCVKPSRMRELLRRAEKGGGPKSVQANVPPIFVSITDLLNIRDHGEERRIWADAKYYDVFKGTPQHITEFCVGVVVNGPVDDPDATYDPFRFPICDDHNCADEQCGNQDSAEKIRPEYQSEEISQDIAGGPPTASPVPTRAR
jgi:hypothetical protein